MFHRSSVLVTGASAGIGRELALQLAAAGARLTLAARDRTKLDEVAHACTALGAEAIAVPTDVADEQACGAMVERAVQAFGGVDVLIANAGISQVARFEDVTDVSSYDRLMRVNYLGAVYCTWHAMPHLRRSSGRIVGVSSLTGLTGVPWRTGYSASKHAMAGFYDSLRIELQDTGVTVTMIYPGFVVSDIRERALGPDGQPIAGRTSGKREAMPTYECAQIILEAAAKRKREVVMTRKARFAKWLKLISPSTVDRIALRTMMKAP